MNAIFSLIAYNLRHKCFNIFNHRQISFKMSSNIPDLCSKHKSDTRRCTLTLYAYRILLIIIIVVIELHINVKSFYLVHICSDDLLALKINPEFNQNIYIRTAVTELYKVKNQPYTIYIPSRTCYFHSRRRKGNSVTVFVLFGVNE